MDYDSMTSVQLCQQLSEVNALLKQFLDTGVETMERDVLEEYNAKYAPTDSCDRWKSKRDAINKELKNRKYKCPEP